MQQYQNKSTNLKIGKRLNRHFPEDDTQIANQHRKRCLTLLLIWEIQIKTTILYYFIPIRMATIKNKKK